MTGKGAWVAGADRREAPGPKPVRLGRRLRLRRQPPRSWQLWHGGVQRGVSRNSITLRGRHPDRAGGDEEFALLDTIRVVQPQQSCRGAALGGSRLDAAPDELEMIN